MHRNSWSPSPQSYFLEDADMISFKETGTSMESSINTVVRPPPRSGNYTQGRGCLPASDTMCAIRE